MNVALPRILLIEDNEIDRLAARRLLGAEFEIEEAQSFAQAVQLCAARAPDCVLLDYRLPDTTGLEALKSLVARHLSVIMLTGEGNEDVAVAAMKEGAEDYFSKAELKAETVKKSIHHVIDKARLRSRLREQERALKVNRQQLFRFLRHLPVGVLVLDADGKPRYLNDHALTLFDPGPIDLALAGDLAKLSRDFPTFDPNTGAPIAPEDTAVMRALRGELVSGEAIEVHHGERVVQLLVNAAPIRSSDGTIEYAVAAFADVSERHHLQEQLRQAQRMESVGRLAGGVAHDFNNLLTAIISFGTFAQRQAEPDSQLHEDVTEVLKAARRAETLTAQLLAFSRRRPVQPEAIAPNRRLEELVGILERSTGEDVELQLDLDPRVGAIDIDPGAFEQVVMNLVINARDAMPQGGVIRIETVLAQVTAEELIRGERLPSGEYCKLRVTDTGHGMAGETQAHIFEPFFSTKGPDKGTGLGLATCYGIIKQASGFIFVDSVPGRGTTFEILLPLLDRPLPESVRPRLLLADYAGTERVLIAEDNDQVRTLTKRVLTDLGYEVVSAANGEEALEMSERLSSIDLLVTDVIMPSMNGRQLAERLGRRWPQLKVVFMTGYGEAAVVHHGVIDPGVVLLSKPFDALELARRVRETLDQDSGWARTLVGEACGSPLDARR